MTEDSRRPTYRDLLKSRGIDIDTLRREREKAQSGCVIRSLQSALGAQATEKEWEMRLRSVRSSGDLSAFGIPVSIAFSMDLANIWDLINRIRTHETPLGSALKEAELEDTSTGSEIKARIADGENVCIIGGLVTNEGLAGFHMAHIVSDGEIVVSRSDDGVPVELEDDTEYLSLVFYPKSD